jgi:radical SAM superfamily enzyme with C-terminal helix-hairpin-helix motif
MNPVNIVKYEKQSRKILNTIVKYNTTGDVSAFGLESADPEVLKKNNIDTEVETTFKAIKIINEIGGKREQGLPKLLPGLNFLHGLIGESEKTLEHNYNFLKKVLDQGLQLRRINIRQVATLDSYPEIKFNQSQFKKYKQKINKNINQVMLKRVFPTGTIINHVLTETHSGNLTYARQLGSYPILIGIPGKLDLNQFISVRVIDHGYRSITALPWPFYVNQASTEQLSSIPGIGTNRANEIFIAQPQNLEQLKKYLGNDFDLKKWKDWFKFII